MGIESQTMGERSQAVKTAFTGVIHDVGSGSPVRIRWDALCSGGLDSREGSDETLSIHGREDEVSPLNKSSQLAEWVRNVHLNAFGHCGRRPQTERSVQCNQLVGDFLAESDTN